MRYLLDNRLRPRRFGGHLHHQSMDIRQKTCGTGVKFIKFVEHRAMFPTNVRVPKSLCTVQKPSGRQHTCLLGLIYPAQRGSPVLYVPRRSHAFVQSNTLSYWLRVRVSGVVKSPLIYPGSCPAIFPRSGSISTDACEVASDSVHSLRLGASRTGVCFSHPIYDLRPYSLPPSRNSDPGSHSRIFSQPPITVRALQFYREKISALS